MIKPLQKMGTERIYLSIIKAIYDKSTANIIINGEKLEPFPPRSVMRWECPFSSLLLNILLDILMIPIRQEKEIKYN